jgi:hypothetical protein
VSRKQFALEVVIGIWKSVQMAYASLVLMSWVVTINKLLKFTSAGRQLKHSTYRLDPFYVNVIWNVFESSDVPSIDDLNEKDLLTFSCVSVPGLNC